MTVIVLSFIKILVYILLSILICMFIYNIIDLLDFTNRERLKKIKLSFDDFYKFYVLKKDRYDLKKQYYYNFEGKRFYYKMRTLSDKLLYIKFLCYVKKEENMYKNTELLKSFLEEVKKDLENYINDTK